MPYVVHFMPGKQEKFQDFTKAFEYFRERLKYRPQVALWRWDKEGWSKLYSSEHYAETLTKPFEL